MFIEKWHLFLYWSDGLGAGHLIIIVGTGAGAFFQHKLFAGPGI